MRSILRTSWLICWTAAFLLSTASAQVVEPPPDSLPDPPRKGPPMTSSVSAVLRVACPADSGLTSPALIEGLIQTGSGVGRIRKDFEKEFGKEALQAAEEAGNLFEISLVTERFEDLPAGIFMADIWVSSCDKRLPAGKILQEVRAGLSRDLSDLERDPSEDVRRIDQMQRESAELEQRRLREAKEIDNLERELGLKISKNVIEQRMIRIDDEVLATQLRISGLTAARQSLRTRIAELAPKVAAAAKQDPVVIELEKVVA
ncbi:MAG TPA: hypothetical protein VGJ26_19375, partial [Pirellulales bacterium]